MKIITISREFGSGGRELGKRLSDILGYDYYDREIITAISEKKGLNESFVENELEKPIWQSIPLTYHNSFDIPALIHAPQTDLLSEQTRIIEEIAKKGKDCIIVGRNADFLLKEYKPFNLFVCADMEAKIKRCKERADKNENISDRALRQKIQRIDKNRARTRDMISHSRWGYRGTYHFIVNTTDWSIKQLAPAVAQLAENWFNR